jgi:hypothetical protein
MLGNNADGEPTYLGENPNGPRGGVLVRIQPGVLRDVLAEAAQIIETTEERIGEAELHRLRGDLLNATRSSGVRAELSSSAHGCKSGAKTLELLSATSLARLWCNQGKSTEARNLLAPAYGWSTEGFDTPVLQEAPEEALLSMERMTADWNCAARYSDRRLPLKRWPAPALHRACLTLIG